MLAELQRRVLDSSVEWNIAVVGLMHGIVYNTCKSELKKEKIAKTLRRRLFVFCIVII
jgi:hypothetical protein